MLSMIQVEVCYATPEQQCLLPVAVADGECARDAILASGILKHCSELNLENIKIGVFSKKCSLETVLKEGDRVEIYRPLTIDPKEARRLRAKKNKK